MSENAIDDEHVIDMVQVRNEVAAEVRARRAAGEYPPAFERELDALFARYAPAEVTENLADALERSEDAAGIDPEIPVASNNPAFGLVKRVMARLLGWYHQFVAQQVTGLGVAVNNVLRSLVGKVTDLESLTGDLERARLEVARIEPERDDDLWRADVVDALTGVRGRVAVLEAGDGALLAAICERGVDAYGVDPRIDAVDAARRRAVDVRLDDVTGHLQAIAPGDLAGVVLRACVERMAAGELLQLLDLATRALGAGGRCIVVSATPHAWGRDRSRVEADLARGRPLHPETWVRLLDEQGYDDIDVRTLGDELGLTPIAADGPDAAAVNANLARISAALFGPTAFIVVATRSRVTAVHQFVPTLTPRDAVSSHYLAVQAALRGAGYRSDLYAWEAKHELRKRARPYKSYRGERHGEPAWLMYHSSVGSPVADFVLGRPEPLIVDYHNITPASFFMRWEPLVVGQLHLGRRQLASLAPRADLGLADSSFNAGELRDLGCRRTDVLPIMFDVRALDRPADTALVARLHAARVAGGADWLFVGRIAPNKAQHDVVKAFAAYRRFHDPAARLHLVGGSSSHGYETALRQYVSALGLDGVVELTGPVSDAELSAYYDTCDVLVVCSEHEGFCVPLLEAMFHDLPVVAYASSAIPETLGDAGLLLDTKEPLVVAAAVDRVLSDSDLRKQMIDAGRARLDAFDLSRSRATLLDTIATVVGAA